MVTLDDDQLKAVQIAAGNKWNAVRNAMGLEPKKEPSVPIEGPSPGCVTSYTHKRKIEVVSDEQDGQVHEGGRAQEEGASGEEVIHGEESEGTPGDDAGWQPSVSEITH